MKYFPLIIILFFSLTVYSKKQIVNYMQLPGIDLNSQFQKDANLKFQRLGQLVKKAGTSYNNLKKLHDAIIDVKDIIETIKKQFYDVLGNYVEGTNNLVGGDQNVILGSCNIIAGMDNFVLNMEGYNSGRIINQTLVYGDWQICIGQVQNIYYDPTLVVAYIDPVANAKLQKKASRDGDRQQQRRVKKQPFSTLQQYQAYINNLNNGEQNILSTDPLPQNKKPAGRKYYL